MDIYNEIHNLSKIERNTNDNVWLDRESKPGPLHCLKGALPPSYPG